jgi:uncharacterized protein (TIGR00369 family)
VVTLERLNGWLPPYPKQLGMVFVAAEPDKLTAEMVVREEFSNGAGTAHGGALMTFADTLGAVATIMNLERGVTTTTLESKTNFLGAAPVGTKLTGEATPLHRGRRTQVWETRITREDGKLIAKVTQTQMVL